MTIEEMKKWIDDASYEDLLRRWRFDPPGSPWFQGKLGDYYQQMMNKKRETADHVAASKRVGWGA